MKARFVLTLMILLAVFTAAHAQTPPPAMPAPEPVPVADWWGEVPSLPPGQVWAEADFLVWWLRGAFLPPLVSTSPAGTPINQAGVLGTNGTTVLFGDSRVNNDARVGFRVALGGWFDEARTIGAEADFFLLEGKGTSFSAQSSGDPILARPFTDALSGGPSAQRIAFPGDTAGSVQVSAGSSGLLGVGLLLRERVGRGDGWNLDVLAGYRSLYFSDHLNVTENLTNTNPNNPNFIPLGANILVADRFSAKNDLQAIDLGLTGEYRQGPVSLSVRGRLAVGFTHEVIDISGATVISAPPAAPAASTGGLLAQTSNIGRHDRSEVSVVPQLDFKLGWQLTENLRASLGYSYLYWGNIARAADQIDRTVNPNLIPPATTPTSGPNNPAFVLQRNALIGQGLNVELEYRY
jgi:hypothetical protein